MNSVSKRERETTRETSLDRAKSVRETEKERESDQTGLCSKVWQGRAMLYFFTIAFIP